MDSLDSYVECFQVNFHQRQKKKNYKIDAKVKNVIKE